MIEQTHQRTPSLQMLGNNASAEEGWVANTSDMFNTTHEHEKPPPPADTGKDAYLFLAACFTLEALVWGKSQCPKWFQSIVLILPTGLPFTYGVFQEYYSTHEPFQGSGNTAVIGTCALV